MSSYFDSLSKQGDFRYHPELLKGPRKREVEIDSDLKNPVIIGQSLRDPVLYKELRRRKVQHISVKTKDLLSHLKNSPEDIARFILEDVFVEGVMTLYDCFLAEVEKNLSKSSKEERSNYYKALHLILETHLDRPISFEIIKYYLDSSFFDGDKECLALLEKSIEEDNQGVFSLLKDHVTIDCYFSETLLRKIASSQFEASYNDLENLYTKLVEGESIFSLSMLSSEDDLMLSSEDDLIKEALKAPHPNYSFIAYTLMIQNKFWNQYEELQDVVKTLCERGDFKGAQWILDLINTEIQKQKDARPSMASEMYGQLSIVADYCNWNLRYYNSSRFPECSQEEIQKIFSIETLDKFKEMLSLDFLEELSDLRPHEGQPLSLERMQEKNIPLFVRQNPRFFEFMKNCDLFPVIDYYKHEWFVTKDHEPMLMVNGDLLRVSEVLEKFETKEIKLGSKIINGIFEKSTGKRWCYLQNGLTEHNPTAALVPVNKVDGDGKYSISFCALDHGNTTTPSGIKRLMFTHSWVKLQDAEGVIYSAGKWGDGLISSPDYYHQTLLPKLVNKIEVTEEVFLHIKSMIEAEQQSVVESDPSFNLLEDNCSCFTSKVAQNLFQGISAKTDLKVLDGFVNRIKYYKGATQIMESLFEDKSKFIGLLKKTNTAQSLMELTDPRLASSMDVSLTSLPAFKSIPLESRKGVKQSIGEIQQVVSSTVDGYKSLTSLPDRASKLQELPGRVIAAAASPYFFGQALAAGMESAFNYQRGELTGYADSLVQEVAGEIESDIQKIKRAFELRIDHIEAIVDLFAYDSIKAFIKTTLKLIKKIEDPKSVYDLNEFIKNIFNGVLVDLQTDNKKDLVNRIFNFLTDFTQTINAFTLHHPYTLFENLNKEVGVKEVRTKFV